MIDSINNAPAVSTVSNHQANKMPSWDKEKVVKEEKLAKSCFSPPMRRGSPPFIYTARHHLSISGRAENNDEPPSPQTPRAGSRALGALEEM